MISFAQSQFDFILLCYSLAFFLLAAVCVSMSRRNDKLPWIWLGAFGLIHGMHEWMDLLAFTLSDNAVFAAIRLGILALSFLCLIEFGRAGTLMPSGKTVGCWVYIPLLGLAGLGAGAGIPGLNATIRYALGLVGGLWAALTLFQWARRNKAIRWPFIAAALALALYGLAAGLVANSAPFFPASVLNQATFLAVTGAPIQFVRTCLAILIGLTILNYYCRGTGDAAKSNCFNKQYWIVVLLLVILTLGWAATQLAERQTDREERSTLHQQAVTAAALLNPERIGHLRGSEADASLPEFIYLRDQLAIMQTANPRIRWGYLMARRSGNVILLVDSTPRSSSLYAPPGTVYQEASRALHNIFTDGQAKVIGPYSDRWGTFISSFAPVRDTKTGQVLAVLGFDINANAIQSVIRFKRLMFITLTMGLALLALAGFIARQRVIENTLRLTESELQFRNMFEHNEAIMLLIDPLTGSLVDANAAACAFYGHSRDALTNLTIADLNGRSAQELIQFRNTLEKSKGLSQTTRHRLACGEFRDLEGHFTLLRFEDRNLIFAIYNDVTASKRAEKELARLGLAVHQSIDGIATASLDGILDFVNEAWARMHGYTATELIGQPLSILHTEEQLRQEVIPLNQQVMAHGSHSGEVGHRRKDGTIFFTSMTVTVIKNENGISVGFLGIAHDITERKHMEEALRESEERFSLFINHCPAAVYIKDETTSLLVASRHFETIFHRPLKELIGQPNEALAPPDVARRWRLEEQEVLKTGKAREIIEELDGRNYITWKFPILRTGKPPLLGGFSLDVTEQKQTQHQLIQAQKMESVGRLAGGIAHDFNNLLQTILGFSELLLAGMPERGEQRDDLMEIQRAARRAAMLTSQLLAFSRKQMIRTETIDLNALVEETGRMLQRLVGEDIHLHLATDDALWRVKADPGQIGQVLMNLVINSRDAMPNGGRITITTANLVLQNQDVRVFPESQKGRYVCLAVADTGAGMSKETMAHLFEPFFTTKGVGKGTGMGLAMVYGLIKQHGGWINAYSEPGLGSTFKIYLPAIMLEAEGNGTNLTTIPAVDVGASTAGKGERILLVEDDAGVRALSILVLQTRGYAVFSAVDAQSALTMFEREKGRFDLLFCDVVLNDVNGIELAEKMRARRPNLRILMTSGYTDERSRWPVIGERGWAFIQKPFASKDLLLTIRRILDQPVA